MYECGKNFFHSIYEYACAAHAMTISQMKDIVEILNCEIKEIRSTNRDMQNYIDSCHKEPEKRAAYLEQSTINFENVANINVNNYSLIPKNK